MTSVCKKCNTSVPKCPKCTPSKTKVCWPGSRKIRYESKKANAIKCSFSS